MVTIANMHLVTTDTNQKQTYKINNEACLPQNYLRVQNGLLFTSQPKCENF